MKKISILVACIVAAVAAWNPIAGDFNFNGGGIGLNVGAGVNNPFASSANSFMKNYADSYASAMNGFSNGMNSFTNQMNNLFGNMANMNKNMFGTNAALGNNPFDFKFDFGKLPVVGKTYSFSTDKNGMKINGFGSVASTSFSTGNLADPANAGGDKTVGSEASGSLNATTDASVSSEIKSPSVTTDVAVNATASASGTTK